MKQRIKRIEPLQLAKVAAVFYGIMGLVFLPIFLIGSSLAPGGSPFGVGLAIAMPVIYAGFGFVFTLVGAVLYNLVAGWVGGIELDLDASAP